MAMSLEFRNAGKGMDWLSWLGQPMLYDGGLCVNRTLEEHEENARHPEVRLVV